MAVTNAYKNQIQNRNFLSPVGFKFTLNRAPKVAFFGNSANIPGMTLGLAVQSTYLKDIDIPGDKILLLDFLLMKILKTTWKFKTGFVVLDIQKALMRFMPGKDQIQT
jgi:hypothetical protein